MQGLSPSKNTEGYFVLQVGSTLSKDAIIHYFARGHFGILCTGGISPISTKASSHWITQVPFISCWWVFLQHWHVCGICSEDSRSKNEATLGEWKYSKIQFSPGTACPSLDTQEASGAFWWRPQARSALSLISMIHIIQLEYQASRRSPWIRRTKVSNSGRCKVQSWENPLRCAIGEPSRSRRSCWWRRGRLAGPAPRGTWLSLVQV